MIWPTAFDRPDGGRIKFSSAALAVFCAHQQLEPADREAGGILLGRLIAGDNSVVVDVAEQPTTTDKRGRFSFLRAKAHAQARVNRAWASSQGTLVYLGDWHTHPEDKPVPSSTDIANWAHLLRSTKCEQACLFFPIVGRRDLVVWEGRLSSGQLDQLEPRLL